MKGASKAFPYSEIIATAPQLEWQAGVPVSLEYDDVFYSKTNGLEESRYVFLAGNDLPLRWSDGRDFTIGELGFGSGLNFFATWKCWLESRAEGILNFVSIEGAPFKKEDIKRAISNWPELEPYCEKFLQILPTPTYGIHRLTFFEERIVLTLCYGRAEDILPQITAEVDAWYLDGFAPVKNSDFWSSEVFTHVARLSAPSATCSTFSVARAVRDQLSTVGFSLSKSKGYGSKREMLRGVFSSEKQSRKITKKLISPKIAIIGSGLAGSNLAYSLSARGAEVTVFESADQIAAGASGNPAGMIMPSLSASPDPRTRLSLCGVNRSISLLQQLNCEDDGLWNGCGVLRLTTSERLRSLYKALETNKSLHSIAIALTAAQASQRFRVSLSEDAIFFASGGIAKPKQLCAKLLESSERIKVLANYRAKSFSRSSDGCGWVLEFANQQRERFDIVIFATGPEQLLGDEFSWITQEAVRGQIAYIEKHRQLADLNTALCYDGYLLPEENGRHVVGATFEHGCFEPEPGKVQQQEILEKLQLRAGINRDDVVVLGGRVGFRASTPDRYPLVGAMPIPSRYEAHYKPVSYSRNWLDFSSDLFYQDLFISTGHASQGLSTAPIAAELIASLIYDEPLPLDKELVDLLNPVRLLTREINKR